MINITLLEKTEIYLLSPFSAQFKNIDHIYIRAAETKVLITAETSLFLFAVIPVPGVQASELFVRTAGGAADEKRLYS